MSRNTPKGTHNVSPTPCPRRDEPLADADLTGADLDALPAQG